MIQSVLHLRLGIEFALFNFIIDDEMSAVAQQVSVYLSVTKSPPLTHPHE